MRNLAIGKALRAKAEAATVLLGKNSPDIEEPNPPFILGHPILWVGSVIYEDILRRNSVVLYQGLPVSQSRVAVLQGQIVANLKHPGTKVGAGLAAPQV